MIADSTYIVSGVTATYQFATSDTNQAIAKVTGVINKLDVNALTTETATTTLTGSLTPANDKVYFLASTGTNADSVGAAAVAINAAATLAGSTAVSYVVVTDANSTSLYKWTDTGNDECTPDGSELVLMGSIDAVLNSSDFIFA